jgi:hypothetical protein
MKEMQNFRLKLQKQKSKIKHGLDQNRKQLYIVVY